MKYNDPQFLEGRQPKLFKIKKPKTEKKLLSAFIFL